MNHSSLRSRQFVCVAASAAIAMGCSFLMDDPGIKEATAGGSGQEPMGGTAGKLNSGRGGLGKSETMGGANNVTTGSNGVGDASNGGASSVAVALGLGSAITAETGGAALTSGGVATTGGGAATGGVATTGGGAAATTVLSTNGGAFTSSNASVADPRGGNSNTLAAAGRGGIAATGGAVVTGGAIAKAGASSAKGGGVASGGTSSATGGIATGGVATGGVATGGVATGGVATGGSPPQLSLGRACNSGSQCDSTYCVDGVCCESACNGVCQSCSASGLCNVTPVTDPDCSNVACPADTTCAHFTAPQKGACKAFAACKTSNDCDLTPAAGHTECASGSFCDGHGACVPAQVRCGTSTCDLSVEECCMYVDEGTYACKGAGTFCGGSSAWVELNSSVATSCDDDADCSAGKVCCMQNGNGNVSVRCVDASSCPSVGTYVIYSKICSTPAAVLACPSNTTCGYEFSAERGQYVLPTSWMTCH